MALLNNRHYLGFEIHPPYQLEAVRRLRKARQDYLAGLDDWFTHPSLDDCMRGLLRRGNAYDIIYADPPWRYKPGSNPPKSLNVENYYHTMSMKDIMSLPVGRLAAENSVLFLWTTGPFLGEAQKVIDAWGFKYKTIGIHVDQDPLKGRQLASRTRLSHPWKRRIVPPGDQGEKTAQDRERRESGRRRATNSALREAGRGPSSDRGTLRYPASNRTLRPP